MEDVKQLNNADLSETQAVTPVAVLANKAAATTESLVKQMELLGESLSSEIKDLRTEIRDTRAEIKDLRTEIRDTRTEIKADIRDVKADIQDVKADIQDVKADIRDISSARRNDRTIIIVMGFGFFIIITALIGAPFFMSFLKSLQ